MDARSKGKLDEEEKGVLCIYKGTLVVHDQNKLITYAFLAVSGCMVIQGGKPVNSHQSQAATYIGATESSKTACI